MPTNNEQKKLNYYLRRASNMATLVVAVFFGAFTLLSILFNLASELQLRVEFRLQPINDVRVLAIPLLALLYFILVIFGAYIIGRWKFFQGEASRIADVKEHDWGKRKKWLVDFGFKYAEYFFIGSMILAFISFLVSFAH